MEKNDNFSEELEELAGDTPETPEDAENTDELEEADVSLTDKLLKSNRDDLNEVIESAYAIDIAIALEDFSDDDLLKFYGKIDDEWAYSTITLCAINPNIAYYLKLVDRFYYTPEVGVNFHFGGLSQKVKGSQDLSLGCWGVGAYLKFASFEFKVTDKIALGLNFGSLSYNSMNVNQKEFKDSLALSSFNFSLNSAEASFKYYF